MYDGNLFNSSLYSIPVIPMGYRTGLVDYQDLIKTLNHIILLSLLLGINKN